jgi:hypothetical protein
VPKAAIDKHAHVLSAKNEVRPPGQFLLSPPSSDLMRPKKLD